MRQLILRLLLEMWSGLLESRARTLKPSKIKINLAFPYNQLIKGVINTLA